MLAGKLDRRITLQRKTVAPSASGEPVETWSTLAERWASVGPVRGDERFTAPQEVARELVEFRIRFSPITADLGPGRDRIVYSFDGSPPSPTAIFDILSVLEVGRRQGQKIIVERNPDAAPEFVD